MKKIILFASGGGSNVKAILEFFKANSQVSFPLIVCNKAEAGVIQIAKAHGIDVLLIQKNYFDSDAFVSKMKSYEADLFVLAGFLWKIPSAMVQAFPNQIINIHPALLPKYGGKGMYGHYVHEAVVENAETESGITIHFVNEHYDEGNIILQEKVAIDATDTAPTVAKKVLALEHQFFPPTIELLLKD